MKYLNKVTDKEIEDILNSCGLDLAHIPDKSSTTGEFLPSIERDTDGIFIRAIDNEQLANFSLLTAHLSQKLNLPFLTIANGYSSLSTRLVMADDYSMYTVLDISDDNTMTQRLQDKYSTFMINKFGTTYKNDLLKEIKRLSDDSPEQADDDNCM